MKLHFLLVLLLSGQVLAKFVDGEGRFYSKDEDKVSFIKNQLLSNSFNDVVSKELKAMGLDADLFWQNFDKKFEEYFHPIQENLKEKYGIGVEGKKERKVDYDQAIRHKRLSLRARFGKINQVISRYTIKKNSRSPQYPNARYLSIQAEVNREALHKVYLKFTTDVTGKSFQKIYLSHNFILQDLSWNEVGVEIEKDFVDVVSSHWKSWFNENFSSLFNETVILDESTKIDIENFLKLPKETVLNMSEDETIGAEYKGSLWVDLKVIVKRGVEKNLLKKREFIISGDIIVTDLENSRVLNFDDFDFSKKVYSYDDNKKLSSSLATFVYQLPIPTFKAIPEKLGQSGQSKKTISVKLKNFRSLKNILEFQKLLHDKGITKHISSSIDYFSSDDASLKISYVGSPQSITDFASSLSNTNLLEKFVTFSQDQGILTYHLVDSLDGKQSNDGKVIDGKGGIE